MEDPFAGLSARERNQLKRKSRIGGITKAPAKPVDVSSSSSFKKLKAQDNMTPNDEKVTVAHKDVTQSGVYSSGDEWPFEGLCEQLSIDLFSPHWHIRHGSAIGLREIIKAHGGGSGKIVGLSKTGNEARHMAWLEDVSIRLICVLALDRFADFVGDQAVVPVRETCAQTLAVVMNHSTPKLCLQVVNEGILNLIAYKGVTADAHARPSAWEVRHAALIGLKYWMAVRPDLLDQVLITADKAQEAPAFTAIIEGYSANNSVSRTTMTMCAL